MVQQEPAGVEGEAFCITWISGPAAYLEGLTWKVPIIVLRYVKSMQLA